MTDKDQVMVIYRCNLCGHLNDTEEPHQGQVMETNKDRVVVRLWCEGSYDKLGVVEYDDDAMESIQDHYETRLNERVGILVEQRLKELETPPTTLEDAASRSRSILRKAAAAGSADISLAKQWQNTMTRYISPPKGVYQFNPIEDPMEQWENDIWVGPSNQEQINANIVQMEIEEAILLDESSKYSPQPQGG